MRKMILVAAVFLNVVSVEAMENEKLNCIIGYDLTSNTKTRQERFKSFVNEEISKICRIDTQFKSVIQSINDMLNNLGISLKIQEQRSGDLACFSHDLNASGFDTTGFLTDEALQKIRKNGLSVSINCKYSRDTRSFIIFDKSGNQELYSETPYCGNVMTSSNASIELREIGVTLCPFYVTLFHELLHLKHFLDTINPDNKTT